MLCPVRPEWTRPGQSGGLGSTLRDSGMKLVPPSTPKPYAATGLSCKSRYGRIPVPAARLAAAAGLETAGRQTLLCFLLCFCFRFCFRRVFAGLAARAVLCFQRPALRNHHASLVCRLGIGPMSQPPRWCPRATGTPDPCAVLCITFNWPAWCRWAGRGESPGGQLALHNNPAPPEVRSQGGSTVPRTPDACMYIITACLTHRLITGIRAANLIRGTRGTGLARS